MPLGKIPKHRVLITKDTNAPETVGGIILPLSLRPVNTGTIVQSGVEDIPINSHVAWDDTLPSIPIIEIEGKSYISMHRNDIKLVIHTKHHQTDEFFKTTVDESVKKVY